MQKMEDEFVDVIKTSPTSNTNRMTQEDDGSATNNSDSNIT